MSTTRHTPEEHIIPARLNERQLDILFLPDVSISMDGNPITNLNRSVNHFIEVAKADPQVAETVNVCVMSFNHDYQVIQNWRPVCEMEPVALTASGSTDIPKALNYAIDVKRHEQAKMHRDLGVECWTPYIVLITDGYGGDCTEVAKKVRQLTEENRMRLWILAVEGYDAKTVAQLSNGERVFALKDDAPYDFKEFFDTMNMVVKAVSYSKPGEAPKMEYDPYKKEGTNLVYPKDINGWL